MTAKEAREISEQTGERAALNKLIKMQAMKGMRYLFIGPLAGNSAITLSRQIEDDLIKEGYTVKVSRDKFGRIMIISISW